jgi:hypothetical protein
VLFEVDSDLEVARTHVKMYESNARQAGALLDALVLHLPAMSGKGLRIAHENIELVHQTLLQGIADLADMTTIIQASVRKVDDGADELMARFDRELDQLPVERRLDIRASLAERGLFERLSEQANDDMALAERVQTRYQSLLQEITLAFEERRVREGDKLERNSGMIALIFGLVGVVTAVEAVLDFRWMTAPGALDAGAGLFVAAVGLVLTAVIAKGLFGYLGIGKLGTPSFRERYRATWSFLTMTSTGSPTRRRASGNGSGTGTTSGSAPSSLPGGTARPSPRPSGTCGAGRSSRRATSRRRCPRPASTGTRRCGGWRLGSRPSCARPCWSASGPRSCTASPCPGSPASTGSCRASGTRTGATRTASWCPTSTCGRHCSTPASRPSTGRRS